MMQTQKIPKKHVDVDTHSADAIISGLGPAKSAKGNSVFLNKVAFNRLPWELTCFKAKADGVVSPHHRALPVLGSGHNNDKSQDLGFSSSWFYFLLKKSYLQKVYINNLTGSELDVISWHDFFFFFPQTLFFVALNFKTNILHGILHRMDGKKKA